MLAHPNEPTEHNRFPLKKVGQKKKRSNAKNEYSGHDPFSLGRAVALRKEIERDDECDDARKDKPTTFLRSFGHG